MTWYRIFNSMEAVLWLIVACTIACQTKRETWQQRIAIAIACVAFVAFGITDLLEVRHTAGIPGWLWGLKIACGAAILASRYTWLGWNRFQWRDREFLFGICLLAATVGVIVLQSVIGSLAP